ncbi:MAG: peptidyl-prolyl cis-trans isomerase [Agathobacter sp.]|uniref:peptidyl-prolyl cis-trans isomerase n=1 Tax=Agathobacter sp. TaxID=2021311 RepID=UPI00258877A7|nr:peptidyl-prolyl cis-trans isomerase [Agathobacter sp.]MCR5676607.1 peptidyl-prolyl cis-trans isomerase [Agathobacter sp.]
MKLNRKHVGVLMAGCICATMLSGCRIGNTEFILKEKKMSSDVAFTLDGEECEIDEVKLYLANYKNLYGTSYGVDLWGKDYDESKLSEYIKKISLSEIERIYAINGLAKQQEVELSESENQKAEEMANEYYESLTDDELEFTGISLKHLTEAYKHYILAQKVYKMMTEGVNEEVSDDEARVMEVQMIFIKDKSQAEIVKEKLSGSSDFAAIGTSYNENDSLETFIARGDYPKEVEDVVFNLDNDAESDMIETEEGYYFVKVINKFDEQKTRENIEKIRLQKQKAQFDDSYDAYIDSAVFHLNQDALDEITLDTDYELTTDSFFSIYKQKMGE